jgi:uncharacterized cupin superfamily protein
MKSMNSFICPVVEDENGEMMLEFPDDLMEAVAWNVGDVLVWEPSLNGTWIIKRFVEEKQNEEG